MCFFVVKNRVDRVAAVEDTRDLKPFATDIFE